MLGFCLHAYLIMKVIIIYQVIDGLTSEGAPGVWERGSFHGMSPSPRAAATRLSILQAATSCFAEKGLQATTTREIARRAGVTQPLIHHYFGSKDELIDAVLAAAVSDYREVQADQWELPLGDPRFFTRGLVVLFRWLGEQPELMRLGRWARLAGRPLASPNSVDVYQQVKRRFEYGQRCGLVRADIDADLALLMIDAMFKGYWDRREEFGRLPFDTADLDDRFMEEAIRVVILGVLEPDAAREALALLELS